MKDTILFTGGSGLLSVCWSRYIYRHFNVCLALHERYIALPGITCLKLDLHSFDSIIASFKEIKPDYVVNTAALTNVEYCEINHEHAFHVNTSLAVNIAKACDLLGIKLIHISTDHIFDGLSSFYTEDSKPNPLNVYGTTKLEAEIGIQDISNNYLIIRTNFFDIGTAYRRSFSDWIAASLYNHEYIDLFEDIYYTPIHVLYLVRYIHQLLTFNLTGIFNVVGPERLSKYQFGVKLAHKFSLNPNLIQPISINDRSDLTTRPRDMSLDNAKIKKIISDNSLLSDHLSLLYHFSASNIKDHDFIKNFIQSTEILDQP
tara:strand:+ start:2339 stop:3286 length:948 start_codon:yes stop_codon:yes gene_type:complete